MMSTLLHERIVENKDWVTLLFVLCFIFIVTTKTAFENRFNDFLLLVISDKYIKIYKDNSNLMSWFTIILFLIQIFSFSFFIQYLLYYFGYFSKTDYILYIQIVTLLTFFILSKFLIEKIIATAFNIEEFIEQFDMLKVSYRTYMGLLLLPLTIILYYNSPPKPIYIYLIVEVLLILNCVIYIKSIKIFQNLIIGKLFYFILYLCALEIAPYYFMYYWFTKS